MRIIKKYKLAEVLYSNAISYPAPSNLNYWWNFGALALVMLIVQITTGVVLAMHYVANADLAFMSIEHIMRNVNYGWLLRYVHANGASLFFLVVYIHIFRGLYYGSYVYPRQLLWGVGVIILLLMILTAFLGYVLPWGQMSFWAATVITNLASAVPLVGSKVVHWLWGGFAVDNPTLNRFYSLHYLFPFIIVGFVGLHLVLLHEYGSNNPLGTNYKIDNIPFHPYYTIKDLCGIICSFIGLGYFVYFIPNLLGHSDNYISANPLVTPTHIVPEWYFLPFYAILRSIPNKLAGVCLLLAAIIILIIFPFFTNPYIRSSIFKPMFRILFWFFVGNCIFLGWIGGNPIESPYYLMGQLAAIFYFLYFFLILSYDKFEEYLLYYIV